MALKQWMKNEVKSAKKTLEVILKDCWWALLLAVAVHCLGGGDGGPKAFLQTFLKIRFVKLPLEL